MATYKQIFGKQVKFLSSDPANEAEGQIWFNSTSDTFKTVVNSGAWVSSAPITTGRYSTASTGTQTASLLMGGNLSPPVGYTAAVEQYNGTGWANETVIPTAIQQGAGAGTITAALFCAGFIGPPPPGSTGTFEYDGSTWTVSNVLANGRTSALSAGTQIAAMIAGGSECPAPVKLSTEEYNGTSWTAGNDMGTSRYQMMGSNVGLQTASLAIGGYGPTGPGPLNNVESYDGTNWTATTVLPVPDGNQARYGIQTAAVAAGGSYTPKITCVEFDGSAWASMPSLATERESNSGSGTTTAGVIGGTAPGSPFTLGYTEEYNVGTTVVVPGAWASAPALSVARYGSVAAGTTQNTALVAAGTQAPSYAGKTETEQYDGSSWTAGGAYPTAGAGMRGCGPQTAVLATNNTVTNYYDGSTWTAQPSPTHNLPVTKSGTMMCGTQTAGLMAGGYVPGPNVRTTATEEYDGSGWTASPGTLTNAVSGVQGFGIQTAAIRVGGDLGPANTTNVDSYNGTTWTASTACPVGIKDGFACGTQTAGLLASGAGPSPADAVSTVCTSFDGTAWFTSPSMATSRRDNTGGSASAPSTSTTNAGGNNPPTTSITTAEEFTGTTTAANVQTITTS